MKRALKQIFYFFLAIFLIGFLLLWTADEEKLERWAESTELTEKIWDYYDYGQYTEDLKDVKFLGEMKISLEGDTTGRGLDPHYYRFYMGEKYDKYFLPLDYINIDNFELLETRPDLKSIVDNAKDREIGVMEAALKVRKFGPGLPLFFSVTLFFGTEDNPYVYHSRYMNLCNKRTLKLGLEHGIDREEKIFAKKFFKIHYNPEQLKRLYRSVYME